MAIHYKVLGQVLPSAASTWTQLYAVPTGKEAVCSSLTVANLTADDILYRVRRSITSTTTFYDTFSRRYC